ncbi:MAG: 3-hydroxypropionyl-coenzyme dehydratase [Actinomycetota bacterium]|nr:3-hydroxypropionyl-coenzyme dehydratase [Actinomycetota bacterium]
MTRPLARYEIDESGVAHITLDDPDTRNALSDEMLDDVIAALRSAKADDSVRVVVLRSSHDRVFSSGGNLKAFAEDQPTIEKYAGLDRFPRLFTLVGELGKPVICAANGDVLAGAFGLALACDLIVAKQSARFGCPEINVGAFPFMISALIYRSISRAKANELMLLGDLVTAEQGRGIGFVNAVVADDAFEATVDEWAQRLAAKSPLLMRLGKNAIAATRDLPLEQALAAMQAQLALAFTTEDLGEGVRAFREKRRPEWRMR